MSQLNKSASKRWNQTRTGLEKTRTGLGSDMRMQNPVEMTKTRFVQGIFTQNAEYLLIQQLTYYRSCVSVILKPLCPISNSQSPKLKARTSCLEKLHFIALTNQQTSLEMDASDMESFVPAPFPDDVPTIQLEKISLNKLLTRDQTECHKIFEICASTGFFYLDMMDHPKGKKLWEDACLACRVGKDVLPSHSIEEKKSYKPRDRVGIFDKGQVVHALVGLRQLTISWLDTSARMLPKMDVQGIANHSMYDRPLFGFYIQDQS